MRLLTIFFLLTIFIFGCKNEPEKLRNHNEFSVLTDQEIQGFEDVLEFFNKIICTDNKSPKRDILRCYRQYLEKLEQTIKDKGVQIPYQDQVEFIESLNPTTFSQIWTNGKKWNDNLDTVNVLNIRYDGAYVDFLESFANKNEKVQKYYERYQTMRSISPTMFSDLLINYEEYDVNDVRMRLLIAVHYLTVNDEYAALDKLKSLENRRLHKN